MVFSKQTSYPGMVTVDGTREAMSNPSGRSVLRAWDKVSKGLPNPKPLKYKKYTYELITIRFGGMAARNKPMGRNAASALRKSLKLSPPPLKAL